jgi:predicted MPP superfamily phosphohydrolase
MRVFASPARGVAAASAALSAAGLVWRMRMVNPYRPVLERIVLYLPPRHVALTGLRIGFVTDIHAGPFIGPWDVERALSLLAEASPDLILLGGDYVSESPRYLGDTMPLIGDLCRAAPLGGIAVLGNHDIFVSASKVTGALEREGITLLRNAVAAVSWRGTGLTIVGIDDSLHGRPDLDAAFRDIPADHPVIALWHEPQFAPEVAGRGAMVQLSGHSHGGQIRIPGIRPAWMPRHGRKHIGGLDRVQGMPIYTSRGLGTYRPPVRLNCPPEVTLVTLE